jgi:hypothetical protein
MTIGFSRRFSPSPHSEGRAKRGVSKNGPVGAARPAGPSFETRLRRSSGRGGEWEGRTPGCKSLYAGAAASTAAPRERVARMIAFSISTTKKKIKPPSNSHGHTPSGSASVSNTACTGGA